MPANLENSAVATGLEKSVFIPIPKKSNTKESSNYHTIALLLHASKVMLKILQARLQQYMTQELPAVQAGFRIGRGIRDQITSICQNHKKSKGIPEKHLLLLECVKAFDCVIAANCELSLKRWEYQTPYLSPEKPVCELRSSIANWSWNNWLVQNWERSMTRLYIVTLLI